MNRMVEPEGHCPLLPFFGAIQKPARTMPVPSQLKIATFSGHVMKEVAEEQARRK